MDYHQNARLTKHSRAQLARKVLIEGCTLKQAAACFNVSAKTAAKRVDRYREHGEAGLSGRNQELDPSQKRQGRTNASKSEWCPVILPGII